MNLTPSDGPIPPSSSTMKTSAKLCKSATRAARSASTSRHFLAAATDGYRVHRVIFGDFFGDFMESGQIIIFQGL